MDDLVVDMPSSRPPDVLITAAESVHGVVVESVRPFAGALDTTRELELVEAVSSAVAIPVVASSGAGAPEHFADVFRETHAAAALAAGIFHRREVGIDEVKRCMADAGIPVRQGS